MSDIWFFIIIAGYLFIGYKIHMYAIDLFKKHPKEMYAKLYAAASYNTKVVLYLITLFLWLPILIGETLYMILSVCLKYYDNDDD